MHYHNQQKENPYFELNARKNIYRSCTYSLVSKDRGSTFSSAANEEEAEGVHQEDSSVEDTATEDDTYDTPELNDLGT